jgi:hypothetical protein
VVKLRKRLRLRGSAIKIENGCRNKTSKRTIRDGSIGSSKPTGMIDNRMKHSIGESNSYSDAPFATSDT